LARSLPPDPSGPFERIEGLLDAVDGDAKGGGKPSGRLGPTRDGSGDTGREVIRHAGDLCSRAMAVRKIGGRLGRTCAQGLFKAAQHILGDGRRAGIGAGAGHSDNIHASRFELAAKLPQKLQVFPRIIDPGQKEDFQKDRSIIAGPKIEQALTDGTKADVLVGTVEKPILGFDQRIHGR